MKVNVEKPIILTDVFDTNIKLINFLLIIFTTLSLNFIIPTVISAEEIDNDNIFSDEKNYVYSKNLDHTHEIVATETIETINNYELFDSNLQYNETNKNEIYIIEDSEQLTTEVIEEPSDTDHFISNTPLEKNTLTHVNNDEKDKSSNVIKISVSELEFKFGDEHDKIKEIKELLNRIGFGGLKITNIFDSKTEEIIKQFQDYYGLTVTGIIDQKTIDKLYNIVNSPLQNGKRHQDTVQLKKDLAFLGFPVPGNGTDYYGINTEKQVKAFQKYYGLVENGIADPVTLNKIKELIEGPLFNGIKREDVKTLKQNLEKLGFKVPGNGTNLYGNNTEKKVKEFQKYYGLKVTGIADQTTIDKINEILNSPLQNGKRHQDTVQLKKDLAFLGFPVPGNGTNLYGDNTEKKVREFQKYYGLVENGIADEVTLKKIKEILNSPLQEGKSHEDTVKLKENLRKLGFSDPKVTNTKYFGSGTKKLVEAFQQHYNLVVNGIADEVTLRKIDEILNSPLQRGKRHPRTVQLKKDLAALGYPVPGNGTALYGEKTEARVKEFQRDYGLPVSGIADEVTLAKIQELLKSTRTTKYNITLAQAVEMQMNVEPKKYENKYAWVSKQYIKDSKVTATTLNVRKGPGEKYEIIGKLSKGTKVSILEEKNGWYAIKFDNPNLVLLHAISNDVRYYLDPENFKNDPIQQFQFLDLTRPSGATRAQLNNYLKGKGTLQNQGQAFIDAARMHRVNEVYLIAHAILETGHGQSLLASGNIKVGEISNNRYVVVLPNGKNNDIYIVQNFNSSDRNATKNNSYNLKNIELKKIYNFFGIGAYDSNPDVYGAVKAYQEGWHTPEQAIIGGAQFVGKNYLLNGQNTLYKMRWNPGAMEKSNKAEHQYATDIAWAYKQSIFIYELFNQIGVKTYYLEIPVYKDK